MILLRSENGKEPVRFAAGNIYLAGCRTQAGSGRKRKSPNQLQKWHGICTILGGTTYMLTSIETKLVIAYRASSNAGERGSIIRRYAEMARLSVGKAEDALDLWVYMLGKQV